MAPSLSENPKGYFGFKRRIKVEMRRYTIAFKEAHGGRARHIQGSGGSGPSKHVRRRPVRGKGQLHDSGPNERGPSTDASALVKRFKVRFPDEKTFKVAGRSEDISDPSVLTNMTRRYFSFRSFGKDGEDRLLEKLDKLGRVYDATVTESYRFSLDSELPETFKSVEEMPPAADLDDVLNKIRAKDAWARSKGAGVSIAIVDTGIDGARPEFPDWKRGSIPALQYEQPKWRDDLGHGTMCACIAAAAGGEGVEFTGVAPEAMLIDCKTRFFEEEIEAIFMDLAKLAGNGTPVVASNSWGYKPDDIPPRETLEDVEAAIAAAYSSGVVSVFSAGNNHILAGGDKESDTPNSIYTFKSRSDLLAVGGCDLRDKIWHYSSRGPGERHGEDGMSAKPDVVAPTPERGKVLYGGKAMVGPVGWGTSGAAPQVSGLAALLLTTRPDLPPSELFDIIRESALMLPYPAVTVGHGVIDCNAAVSSI